MESMLAYTRQQNPQTPPVIVAAGNDAPQHSVYLAQMAGAVVVVAGVGQA